MNIAATYKDVGDAAKLVTALIDNVTYVSEADLGDAAERAREASELLAQAADDFAALDAALSETRGE